MRSRENGDWPSTWSRSKIVELYALGEACVEAWLKEDGLGVVETLQSIVEGQGDTETQASLIADELKGRLLPRCDSPDLKTAEDCFTVLSGSVQWATGLESCVAPRGLARMLRDTGRCDEAGAMLAEFLPLVR